MSSFATSPHPVRSTMYDVSDHQLCMIFQSAIPRLDIMHKIVNFIKVTKLDGKTFMTMNNRRLARLANHDPLVMSKFQDLRVAQPQDIQSLLGPRREPTPEPTTQEEASEDLHEEAIDPVSNSQFHPLDDGPSDVEGPPVPSNPDSHHLTLNVAISIEAAPIFTEEGANTQTSTDVSQNASSLNREPATFHPDAGETPSSLEPAEAPELEFTSPTDRHAVPLPQLDGFEVDLLNVEENDIYHDDVSSDEAVGSELEPERFSTDDDISDDESQAWSVVDHEEVHVAVENEVQELQGGSSSPFDVIHESSTEDPPRSSIVRNVDSSPAAQSPLVGQSNPGLDQMISADVDSTLPSDVSDSDRQHSNSSEVEQMHEDEAELSLPTPPVAENQQELSPNDLPTSILSEPELSGDDQEAKESHNSMTVNESVDSGQSPPNSVPDQPQPAYVICIPESEPETPALDQATTASVADEPTSAGASITKDNTPEVTDLSHTVSSEEPFEAVVNDLPEEQTIVTNETPSILLSDLGVTDFESTHLSYSEELLPSLSHPETHGESVPITDDSAIAVHFAEELDSITFEDSVAPTNSAHNDDIPIANVSVELDMSVSASPASSSRSVFTDSPISFQFLSPVSPVLCFDGGRVLLFCEEDYGTFLTSTSIDVAQILPFSSKSAGFEEINLPVDFDGQATNELCLVDHVLPTDDTAPDDLMSFFPVEDPFYIPSSLEESSQIDEPASSSNVNLINLLDDEVGIEDPTASESISTPVVPPLLDEHRAEAADPASAMGDGVPVVPLPSVSGMLERQLTGVSDNNSEEGSILSDDVGQQAPNEPTFDGPLSETREEVELSRFRGLPTINTNIASLMDELSAFLSPEGSVPHNPIVHVSPPTPSASRPRLSSGSPTRSLFPMSERVTSERTIANYTKRLHNRREAIERPVSRSDIAIQTDLDSQHRLRQAQDEYSTIGNIASTLVSPLSTVSASFRQFFGLGGDRPQPEQLPFREIDGSAIHPPS